MTAQRFVDWSFGHYLQIAHPGFALDGPHGGRFASATDRAPHEGAQPVGAAA
jgi:menaquinone-9 beta-reductase